MYEEYLQRVVDAPSERTEQMRDLWKEIAKHALSATQEGNLKWIHTDEGFRSEELDQGLTIILQRRPHGGYPEMKFSGADWMTSTWDSSDEVTDLWNEVENSDHWAYIKNRDLEGILTTLKRRGGSPIYKITKK